MSQSVFHFLVYIFLVMVERVHDGMFTVLFHIPRKINTQISRMPDGKVYFCIARAFEKGIEKYGAIKSFVSIGLRM